MFDVFELFFLFRPAAIMLRKGLNSKLERFTQPPVQVINWLVKSKSTHFFLSFSFSFFFFFFLAFSVTFSIIHYISNDRRALTAPLRHRPFQLTHHLLLN